ncbi:hypothetical protein K8Z61_11025 [Nocardioides sp. TRM66260-LWL]|uniref:hypothetical protein n=1 Tax=Nocardioides sp. TRM66260-LWL TaxID=2874478 RepID=UPI001CC65332|nr:hypothetical protein [Nocardioides sp. TRM66260-LWL]MBZ5735031.1 hypothetical protein [Nocardioides sp. TRM66260-LWL]
MTELSDLLRANLPKGWSARQVAREARKRGHKLSDAAATSYIGGRHGTPSDQMLEALADTLRIPLARLRSAAGLVAQVGDPWVPPESSRYLRGDQRAALERLIATMVIREEEGRGEQAEASSADDQQQTSRPALAVADGGADEGEAAAAAAQAAESAAAQRREIAEMKERQKRGE